MPDDTSLTTDDPVERVLRDEINAQAPWPGLRDERGWFELTDDEREHYRILVRRVREAIATHG